MDRPLWALNKSHLDWRERPLLCHTGEAHSSSLCRSSAIFVLIVQRLRSIPPLPRSGSNRESGYVHGFSSGPRIPNLSLHDGGPTLYSEAPCDPGWLSPCQVSAALHARRGKGSLSLPCLHLTHHPGIFLALWVSATWMWEPQPKLSV